MMSRLFYGTYVIFLILQLFFVKLFSTPNMTAKTRWVNKVVLPNSQQGTGKDLLKWQRREREGWVTDFSQMEEGDSVVENKRYNVSGITEKRTEITVEAMMPHLQFSRA